jgi:hypothetical protein
MSKRKIPASALCPAAYRAFMQLIEEAEDERDDDIIANAKPYDPNTAIPLDDL